MKTLDIGDKIYSYNKSVIIKFNGKRAVLSTGVINGGYSENLTAIFNHDAKTAPGMGCQLKAPTYKEHMEIISTELGLDFNFTTGIGTAADMKNMSIVMEKHENLSVTALVTAGIETNGGRVGDVASYIEKKGKIEKTNHGTINIIVSINGNLPVQTLTRALITITEAKTAAIQELLEGSKYSHGLATGSGTDGVIVYSNLESEDIYTNAGKHSKLGELLGKAVKKAVKDALAKQSNLTPERQKSIFRRARRYGVTAEKIWKKYIDLHPENINKKLEYMEFIEKIEKNEKIVASTSLYVHLIDQFDWDLLSKEITGQECGEIQEKIEKFLKVKPQIINKNKKKEKFEKKELEKEKYIDYLVEKFIDIFVNYTIEKWEA